MSIVVNGTISVSVSNASIHFNNVPDAADGAIGDYPGYFESSDVISIECRMLASIPLGSVKLPRLLGMRSG